MKQNIMTRPTHLITHGPIRQDLIESKSGQSVCDRLLWHEPLFILQKTRAKQVELSFGRKI